MFIVRGRVLQWLSGQAFPHARLILALLFAILADSRHARAAGPDGDDPKAPLLSAAVLPAPGTLAALAAKPWTEAAPGLQMKEAEIAGYGLRILAWKFDPALYAMTIATQLDDKGSTARQMRAHGDAVLAVNGGFFDIDTSARLSPSGALVAEGRKLSGYRERAGSAMLYDRDGRIGIGWSKDWGALGDVANAVQVGPMLVDPGGRNGIARNDLKRHNRTAVCLTGDKRLIVTVVTGGLSLFDLGTILAAGDAEGGLACERAINLDGGPSTQASFRSPDGSLVREVETATLCHNFVLLRRRVQ